MKHTVSIYSLLIWFSISWVYPAYAEQLAFKKDQQAEITHFSYKFKDHSNKTHALKFTLSNSAMFNKFRRFRAYKPSRVQESLLMTLKKAAAKADRRKVNIEFVSDSRGIEMILTGENQQLNENTLKSLLELRDKTHTKLLKKSYYNILETKQKQRGVKPDHVRFANESRKDIQTITQAIMKANPKLKGRKLVEYILAFVQSIPYSTLESRLESNGAGFSPPLRLINNNQGDCDSKVTLMASMLNAIYPRIKIVIIYLSDHALIGVQMTHRKQDKWIKLKDREYILAEPTGPAMLPFGTVAESSEFYVDGEQFSHEIF